MHSAEDHACNLRHADTTCIEDLIAETREEQMAWLLSVIDEFPHWDESGIEVCNWPAIRAAVQRLGQLSA
jgi:hypothetical protein